MKFQLALVALLVAAATAGRRSRPRKLSLLASESRTRSRTLSRLFPFYHSSDTIHNELVDLASRCNGMMALRSVEGTGADGSARSVDVVTIRASGSTPTNRNFLLFGEHSRELISPESGLHFAKTLCGETGLGGRAREILRDNEFQMVVNGNPASRRKVEQGDFCLRTNPDGVDLNRNWDERWQAGTVLDPADTNPGPKPFSEPETRVFRQLVEEYRPTTFLTVHSGTKGMYMPWAFDMQHLAERNQPQMMQILRSLDKDHCQCPFGAAGREVGYSCPGTCLDWVYDRLKAPYAFAFEIYTGPENDAGLRDRWQQLLSSAGGAFLQEHSHLGHSHFHDLFSEHPSCFVQLSKEHRHHHRLDGLGDMDCFALFNPGTQEAYAQVLDNWSAAYLDMAAMVVVNMKGNTTGM